MLPLLGDKKKISEGIVSKIVKGKEEYSTGEKEYSDSCKMAAVELIKAIKSEDIDAVINAFIALDSEVSEYTDEGGPEIEIEL